MQGNQFCEKKDFPGSPMEDLTNRRPLTILVSEKGMEGEQYAHRGCAERGRLVKGPVKREPKSPRSLAPEGCV